MGILTTAAQFGRRMARRRKSVRASVTLADDCVRQPHFESLEPRVLLAGDLVFGSVYFEEASGDDSEADMVFVTFLGGAEGTQLDRLVIDGDKKGDGLSEGDAFVDTAAGGTGAFNYVGLALESHVGFEITRVTAIDGGSLVVLEFSGFDAGEKLVFSVDVDEVGFVDPSGAVDSTSVVEGGEFQRSRLTGDFSAPHYADLQLDATFWDSYDDNFAEIRSRTGRTLDLPPDRYTTDDDLQDRTAGAIVSALQEPLPITISGTVFADANVDNRQDPGEQGLANVRLHLWNFDPETGQYVDTGKTALTDRQGAYRFDDYDGLAILPGRYEIREVQPAGYFSDGARAGNVDGVSRGVVNGPDTITQIDLLGGQDSVRNDFAEALPASLSGYVYHDASNDGLRDGGERGIANVAVHLLSVYTVDGSTAVIDTWTNADGFWQVSGLAPGTYDVVEPNQPAAYLDGLDRAGTVAGSTVGAAHNPGDKISDVQLQGGQSGVEYNFGELLSSSISGQVHASMDGDCTPGPDDILLAGVQIDLLDELGRVLTTTHTNQEGRYQFDDLTPGSYQVFEHQPEGYFDGPDHVGTAGGRSDGVDTIMDIPLTSGTHAEEYDFCEYVGVNLAGYVYHDADNDGHFDADETAIGGVTLLLLDAEGRDTGQRATTSTAADTLGYYEFADLRGGTYGVRELQPDGYLDGIDTPGNRGGEAENPGDRIAGAVLPFGQSGTDYNFGELLPSSISGQVHASMDGDCTPGPDDILLAGVQIDLLDESGRVLTTTHTNQEGRYQFDDLTPGSYQVFEHQPEGYFDGPDHVGTAGGRSDGVDTIMDIPLTSGTHAEEYNFCEYVGVNLAGYVYHDADNDGHFDADETAIGGVTLLLLDAEGRDTGQRATTSTAADTLGYYEFADLRGGTYGVRELQPDGYLDGIDTPGNRGGEAENPGDRIVGAVLPFGQSGTDYNFGELLPARISGTVRVRTGQDCFVEKETQPIAGVVIELLGRDGQIVATTRTDASGRYVFAGLQPDTYGVHERQPDGYFQGSQRVGSGGGQVLADDLIGAIPAGSGQQLMGYDFCEVPPAAISGHVFQDGGPIPAPEGVPNNVHELRDGLYTDDDRPLAGVTLELRHGVSGDPILASAALPGHYPPGPIRTTTDASGFYEFGGLAAGTYAVFEVHPSAFVDSIDTAGSAGGVAVNPHEPVSPFILMQLTVDPADDAILRIPLKAGQTSTDNNFSEVLVEPIVPPPPPPAPVPVTVPVAPAFLPAPARVWLPLWVPPSKPATPFGGSSQVIAYTWHLSVIDGGQPRSNTTNDMLVQTTGSRFDVIAWRSVDMRRSSWKFRQVDIDGEEARRRAVFGTPDAIPVTGDFNGDGITEQGVFIDGQWFIDLNGNGQWDPEDLWVKLGHDGDLPVTGDWDGDGKTDIGIFGLAWPGDPMAVDEEPGLPDPQNVPSGRPKNIPPDPPHAAIGARTMKLTSQGKMRADVIDHVFHYGTAGDWPVAGDWNGDGIDTIGVFRDGQWRLDTNGDGKGTNADRAFTFGQAGDVPVVGDWNGDGVDEVGIYRNGTWHLDANGNRQFDARDQVFQLGTSADVPVTGDWNGDGVDEPGVYLKEAG